MQHDVRQKSYFVHKFSRATLITGKAGLTMLSNKIPTASQNTLKVITPTSDRFTTSTEWSITTTKNACPISSRSLMMSTMMSRTLSSTAWAKDPRKSQRKYAQFWIWLAKTVLLTQKKTQFLDWKYDRKVAKNLRGCQDNFCWEGLYQDISFTSGVASAIKIFMRKFRLFSNFWALHTYFWLNPSLFHSQDIASFISAITIPDYVPVTRHNFAPPPPKEVTKVSVIIPIPHHAFCR